MNVLVVNFTVYTKFYRKSIDKAMQIKFKVDAL